MTKDYRFFQVKDEVSGQVYGTFVTYKQAVRNITRIENEREITCVIGRESKDEAGYYKQEYAYFVADGPYETWDGDEIGEEFTVTGYDQQDVDIKTVRYRSAKCAAQIAQASAKKFGVEYINEICPSYC